MTNRYKDEVSVTGRSAHSYQSPPIQSTQFNRLSTTTSTTLVATLLITNTLTPVESDSSMFHWFQAASARKTSSCRVHELQPECDWARAGSDARTISNLPLLNKSLSRVRGVRVRKIE